MTYLPLVAFIFAVAWMVYRGFKAKAAYLRRQRYEDFWNKLMGDSGSIGTGNYGQK